MTPRSGQAVREEGGVGKLHAALAQAGSTLLCREVR